MYVHQRYLLHRSSKSEKKKRLFTLTGSTTWQLKEATVLIYNPGVLEILHRIWLLVQLLMKKAKTCNSQLLGPLMEDNRP